MTANGDKSKFVQWLMGIFAALITAAVCWIAAESRSMRIEMTKIGSELEFAKPRDVLAAVNSLRGEILTEDRVRQLIDTQAPWLEDRREWEKWRVRVDSRLDRLEEAGGD